MNPTTQTRAATPPNPVLAYQGAYLPLYGASLALGPFQADLAPQTELGVGYSIAQSLDGRVPVTTVRPARLADGALADQPDKVVQIGYEQNGTGWLMTFCVVTDPHGGLIGADFALEVHSNYPEIPMGIVRTPINQPRFEVLTKAELPADYRAQFVLKFWGNGRKDLALDGWLAVQVAYVQIKDAGHLPAQAGIPLVTTGEVVLFPTPGGGDNPVIGNNYPAPRRFDEPRLVRF